MVASAHNAFLELFGDESDEERCSEAQLPSKPVYRVVTGHDDATFCDEVSVALTNGYRLWGSPTLAVHDGDVFLAQALVRGETFV